MITADKYRLDFLNPVIPIIAIFVGLIPNIIYIYYNELEKRKFESVKRTLDRKFELYKKRESTYGEMIKYMRGFYIDGDKEQRELFLHTLRLSWLYCPDHVIKKANELVDLCTKRPSTDRQLQSANTDESARVFGELIQEMRKDLIDIKEIESTSLTANDIKHQKG